MSKIRLIFRNHPFLANTFVYGSLYCGAEFAQQTLLKKIWADPREEYDTKAVARYAIFGTCVGAPVLYNWYKWLDKRLPGTDLKTIVKKVVLDQFVMTPPLTAGFFITMSILEQKADVFEELKEKFIPTYQKSCLFWLPAQCINFTFVPPPARIVYVSVCAFVWINILCWVKRQVLSKEKDKHKLLQKSPF